MIAVYLNNAPREHNYSSAQRRADELLLEFIDAGNLRLPDQSIRLNNTDSCSIMFRPTRSNDTIDKPHETLIQSATGLWFRAKGRRQKMRLADFIDADMQAILSQWEVFASSLTPAAAGMDSAGLRDHAEEILRAIAKDLRTSQNRPEQSAKSKGQSPVLLGAAETAAQTHAVLRATGGFSIRQLVAEYRALRASVLRLWGDAAPYDSEAMEDVGRFNEAIDQAIAESVDYFTNEVDRWRAIFLGVLGHDLRGPLTAVMLTSQLISAQSAGTPVSKHTARLIRSGERMRKLLDDLLDFNRTSLQIGVRITAEPADLAEVCLDEVELLRTALPESTINFEAQGAAQGNWDASRIKQVLSNLVINAAKYGDPHNRILVTLRSDDSKVLLTVENAGSSIPKELMNDLFEPLRRHGSANSRGEKESLGLGLFIVRQVVLAHGGTVTVASADAKTCFTVTLPKRQTETAEIVS